VGLWSMTWRGTLPGSSRPSPRSAGPPDDQRDSGLLRRDLHDRVRGPVFGFDGEWSCLQSGIMGQVRAFAGGRCGLAPGGAAHVLEQFPPYGLDAVNVSRIGRDLVTPVT
jgi:hypothetical protein